MQRVVRAFVSWDEVEERLVGSAWREGSERVVRWERYAAAWFEERSGAEVDASAELSTSTRADISAPRAPTCVMTSSSTNPGQRG